MRSGRLDRSVARRLKAEPPPPAGVYRDMLKLAAVLLVLMILFGVLGFVVHVAAAVTKAAFFVCLVALGASLAMKAMRRE